MASTPSYLRDDIITPTAAPDPSKKTRSHAGYAGWHQLAHLCLFLGLIYAWYLNIATVGNRLADWPLLIPHVQSSIHLAPAWAAVAALFPIIASAYTALMFREDGPLLPPPLFMLSVFGGTVSTLYFASTWVLSFHLHPAVNSVYATMATACALKLHSLNVACYHRAKRIAIVLSANATALAKERASPRPDPSSDAMDSGNASSGPASASSSPTLSLRRRRLSVGDLTKAVQDAPEQNGLDGEPTIDVPTREARKPPVPKITLSHLMYFVIAPTLNFRFRFPTTNQPRSWSRMFRSSVVFNVGCGLALYLLIQFVFPTIHRPEMIYLFQPLAMLETSPTLLLIFITAAWGLFDGFVPLMAEITMYGDRDFHDDYWNALNLGEFWTLWNRVTHFWLRAHVYIPLYRRTRSSRVTILLLFFISGVMHDVVFWMVFGHFTFLFAVAFMVQIPLLTPFRNSWDIRGVMIIWVSLLMATHLFIWAEYRVWYHGLSSPWSAGIFPPRHAFYAPSLRSDSHI